MFCAIAQIMREMGPILPVIMSGIAKNGNVMDPPVQLIKRGFGQTLLQNTLARFDSDLFLPPVIISVEHQLDEIRSQISDLGIEVSAIISESLGKGTTNCAILAALYAQTIETDPLVLLSPSDQYVQFPQALRRSIAATIPVAYDGYVATFGMMPEYPETDYAYLRKSEPLRPGTFLVDHFVDNPSETKAEELIASGKYYWNMGTYLYEPNKFLSEVIKLEPLLFKQCKKAFQLASQQKESICLATDKYVQCKSTSVEKAIMEKIENRALIPVRVGWSDRGEIFSSMTMNTERLNLAS